MSDKLRGNLNELTTSKISLKVNLKVKTNECVKTIRNINEKELFQFYVLIEGNYILILFARS